MVMICSNNTSIIIVDTWYTATHHITLTKHSLTWVADPEFTVCACVFSHLSKFSYNNHMIGMQQKWPNIHITKDEQQSASKMRLHDSQHFTPIIFCQFWNSVYV